MRVYAGGRSTLQQEERSQKNWGPQHHLRKARKDQRNTGGKGTGAPGPRGEGREGSRSGGIVCIILILEGGHPG